MILVRQWPAILGSTFAVLFFALGYIAHRAHAGTVLDHRVLHLMIDNRHAGLTSVAVFLTDVLSPDGMWVAGIVAGIALCWWQRSPLPALVILGSLLTTRFAVPMTKDLFGTQRPPVSVRLVVENSPSYPSGHALTAAAILGVLAVITGYERTRSVRIWLGVAAATGVIAVALTRLYLGVHWLSDVTGGALFGGVIVAFAAWIYSRYAPQTSRPALTRREAEDLPGTR